jgi:lipoate-protein ligase B
MTVAAWQIAQAICGHWLLLSWRLETLSEIETPEINPQPTSASPPPKKSRPLHWTWLGGVPYSPLAALQESLRQDLRYERGEEHFLLLEHDPPVFTLGRNATEADVVASPKWLEQHGVEVHQTNRGGQVTYHGPGQLVGYPILNLNPDRRDVRHYVRDLQEVLIRTLADFDVVGERREGQDLIGIWVGNEKIASIGVHLSRWITLHGFALNIYTDLSHFDGIVACGLPKVQMTSIERLLGEAPPMPAVAARAADHLGRIFGRELQQIPSAPLLEMLDWSGEMQ